MHVQQKLVLSVSLALLAACSSSSNSPRGQGDNPATNNNGTPQTGVVTAQFNPAGGATPLPINLAFLGTRDLTLNPTVANPNNFGDPNVAISALDGWSTIAPWSFKFNSPSAAAPLANAPLASTIVPGQTVRMFEVTLSGPGGRVTGITRELAAGTEFVTGVSATDTSGRTIGVVPTKALKQLTSYMVVVTNGITDAAGNNTTPDQTYFLTQRTSPLCVNNASTDPLLPTANACALEPLRILTNAQEAAAAGAGIDRSKIVLSWVATTQSINPVLQAVRATNTARTARVAPTGLNTSVVGAGIPPVADIFIGTIDLRYFLTAPSATNPTGPLTGFWRAAPGAYSAQFASLGLDPTSTNLTFANPIPVSQSTQTVPLILTVPNANSQRTKPAAGWPIVIFNHGITRNRTDALAIAATMAGQGFAVIAIDQPLHGVGPTSPFYIENTPFGPIAGERTFDLDLSNNTTGAAGPDGVIDGSGTYTINLSSLLTSRDNLRQTIADLFALTATIPSINLDNDAATVDFDATKIGFVGQSLGAITGTGFLALEPNVNISLLSVPGGGIARMLDGSASFGPRIRAGLAASGVTAGTATYDAFMFAAQTVTDSADPMNFAAQLTTTDKVLMHLVVGNGTNVLPDQVVPVSVPGAPLSGGEPLARAMGLSSIVATTQSATGIKGVTRFVAGDHGSLLSPAASGAATVEMQGQMASMIVSSGNAVQVTNTSVIRTQ